MILRNTLSIMLYYLGIIDLNVWIIALVHQGVFHLYVIKDFVDIDTAIFLDFI